jgi:hypothetical protein
LFGNTKKKKPSLGAENVIEKATGMKLGKIGIASPEVDLAKD